MTKSTDITLSSAQAEIDKWIKEHGVRYFSELTNMAILTEEVGELASIMARTYGEQSRKPEEKYQSMAEEINDILFVLICIANQTGVNMTKAFNDGMEKRTTRDINRHKNNPKLR